MRKCTRTTIFVLIAALAGLGQGCQNKPVVEPEPDYSRQLPPGASALRLVEDPSRMPDLGGAWENVQAYRPFMLRSLDNSAQWFEAPSSRQFFPMSADTDSITHEQAKASVKAFRELVEQAPDREAFITAIERRFNVYESVGYNNEGIVLFTGYYAPVFDASRTRTDRFDVPLYTRPDDLVTDPVTGEPRGRRTESGDIVPYDTRAEIERSKMFAGNELVWLDDDLSAYIIHVNGSAKLRLRGGGEMYVGYAGKTDRPYYGLGRSMVEAGLIDPDRLSLPAIKSHYRKDPEAVRSLMNRNENYVFFTEYDPGEWPAGSLGVEVTEEASLATDKSIYPRGGVVLVDTEAITLSNARRRFLRFMMDQDTGGAIKAPGRADIFMGTGETAEILAGGQYAEGRLYYLFLKPSFVDAETAPLARW